MRLNLLDRIGNWNPQLLREIQGRFKVFNVIAAITVSLIFQLGLYLCQVSSSPLVSKPFYLISDRYCRLSTDYQEKLNYLNNEQHRLEEDLSNSGNLEIIKSLNGQIQNVRTQWNNLDKNFYTKHCPLDQIDIQLWWRDHWEYIFLSLSVMLIFTLLVAGTYLLINDLAKEQNRGTFNFIRLSPQSETSILIGKMLGVPSLIYLVIAVAIPLHLYAGHSAEIAFSYILSFYAVLAASCIFFFSAALLFGLVGGWSGAFQAWLGTGAVLMLLITTFAMAINDRHLNYASNWFRFLSPFDMAGYLFPNLVHRSRVELLEKIQFFYLPVGKSLLGLIALHFLNYGVWTYWIWQGLKRRFRNPNITIINKSQSYFLVTCVQIALWGFTLSYSGTMSYEYDTNYQVLSNFVLLVLFNVILLLGLVAILSPGRQTIQDWARYRHQNTSRNNSFWKSSLLGDLIVGEKSLAIIAVLINLVIFATPLAIWILIAPALDVSHSESINWIINKVGINKAILGIALFMGLIMICASLAQRIFLLKTPKRFLWAIAAITTIVVLPFINLQLLHIQPEQYPILFLLSIYPWAGLTSVTISTIFMTFLGEFIVLVLLNINLVHQTRLLGESSTKALLAMRR